MEKLKYKEQDLKVPLNCALQGLPTYENSYFLLDGTIISRATSLPILFMRQLPTPPQPSKDLEFTMWPALSFHFF